MPPNIKKNILIFFMFITFLIAWFAFWCSFMLACQLIFKCLQYGLTETCNFIIQYLITLKIKTS